MPSLSKQQQVFIAQARGKQGKYAEAQAAPSLIQGPTHWALRIPRQDAFSQPALFNKGHIKSRVFPIHAAEIQRAATARRPNCHYDWSGDATVRRPSVVTTSVTKRIFTMLILAASQEERFKIKATRKIKAGEDYLSLGAIYSDFLSKIFTPIWSTFIKNRATREFMCSLTQKTKVCSSDHSHQQ